MPPRKSLSRELRAIQKSFRQLATQFKRIEPVLARAAAGDASASKTTARRRGPKLSPKRRAALKLQGQYMGTLRGLPARKQARVKRIRKEKGMRAAVAEARKLAR